MAIALVATFVAMRADAWQEAHQTADDVEIQVDPAGLASVRHQVRWHVVRGPLKWIDLVNLDAGMSAIEPVVKVTSEDGRELSAHVAAPEGKRDENIVRIEVDEPRAFMRGTFTFEVRYRIDWVASRALSSEGVTWRLNWSSPVAADGFDSARLTLDLPAAPEEPRPILPDTGAVDDAAVSTLRREPTRDVLELVRPHVARGESVSWTVRLDPRALPAVVDPRLRPASRSTATKEPDRLRDASLLVALGGLALGFALLVGHKTRAFSTACSAQGGRANGLLPLPQAARAPVAGLALAGGVGLQVLDRFDSPMAGAALVALATLAAALRSRGVQRPPRGPGRWLALRPEDAFAPALDGGHWLDVGTRAGRWTGFAGLAAVLALAFATHFFDARGPWLVAMDALAFVPLLTTGRGSSLRPDGVRASAPWLAKVFERLHAIESLRVAPWVRIGQGGFAGDELRVLVLPRATTPGLVGIEIGLAWSTTPTGWAGTPEVLVRVLEGSPAAGRLAQAMAPPHAVRAQQGRRPDERVVRLLPRMRPLASATSAVTLTRDLALELAQVLTDRRKAGPARLDAQPERRAPFSPLPRRSPEGGAKSSKLGATRAASQIAPPC